MMRTVNMAKISLLVAVSASCGNMQEGGEAFLGSVQSNARRGAVIFSTSEAPFTREQIKDIGWATLPALHLIAETSCRRLGGSELGCRVYGCDQAMVAAPGARHVDYSFRFRIGNVCEAAARPNYFVHCEVDAGRPWACVSSSSDSLGVPRAELAPYFASYIEACLQSELGEVARYSAAPVDSLVCRPAGAGARRDCRIAPVQQLDTSIDLNAVPKLAAAFGLLPSHAPLTRHLLRALAPDIAFSLDWSDDAQCWRYHGSSAYLPVRSGGDDLGIITPGYGQEVLVALSERHARLEGQSLRWSSQLDFGGGAAAETVGGHIPNRCTFHVKALRQQPNAARLSEGLRWLQELGDQQMRAIAARTAHLGALVQEDAAGASRTAERQALSVALAELGEALVLTQQAARVVWDHAHLDADAPPYPRWTCGAGAATACEPAR